MTNTTARIRKGSLTFEIIVDMDEALKFKKGLSNFISSESDKIFTDIKKGNVASKSELEKSFGTIDINEITKIIIKQGDVEINQEHRDEEKEKKIRQVVDFLARNSTNPQTGNPHSPDRIRSALEQAHINIKNVPIEEQIEEILSHISSILPIKIETKRIKILIPAIHTGRAYGIISPYKEKEDWLNDGSLEVVVNIPAGIIIDFYDKLNSVTHGSIVATEMKEN
jgi:ribosome maturation protein SDO1